MYETYHRQVTYLLHLKIKYYFYLPNKLEIVISKIILQRIRSKNIIQIHNS